MHARRHFWDYLNMNLGDIRLGRSPARFGGGLLGGGQAGDEETQALKEITSQT